MNNQTDQRVIGFAVIGGVYLLAAALGVGLYLVLPYEFWLNLLLADVAATVLTFGFSVALRNASVYDPYWSVQPPVIVTAFAVGRAVSLSGWLVLIAVWVWGIRLTGNWVYTFHGLSHQDWRYTMLHETTGKWYPLVNFTGIHMVPTLIVYACVLPGVLVIRADATVNFFTLLFFALSIAAVTLQGISDWQMHAFRRQKTGGLIRVGLWKYARHPNYLGELLMWWGVAGMAISVLPFSWMLIVGALSNTVLFLTVSIPMADRRQSKKPGFDEYKRRTRMLLPLPKWGEKDTVDERSASR